MMKTPILLLTTTLVIGGCATARFDNKELTLATEIRFASAQVKACDNLQDAAALAKLLYEQSKFFAMYAEHIPDNTETIKMAAELVKEAEPFNQAYADNKKPSTAYCKNKLEIVNHSANSVQRAMAIKLRK